MTDTWVSRKVRKAPDPNNPNTEIPRQDLTEYRSQPAWVLLGEPGAGKSTAFEMEAAAVGGIPLAIGEFAECGAPPGWQGETLFLDGLDETRAGGGERLLPRVRRKLQELGKPPFRIACRAADWYGASDRDDLRGAVGDGQLAVLLLEPLEEGDILTILRNNHGVADPQAFVQKAEKRGIAGLLDNPQTLGLLAQAIRAWVSTQARTGEELCTKTGDSLLCKRGAGGDFSGGGKGNTVEIPPNPPFAKGGMSADTPTASPVGTSVDTDAIWGEQWPASRDETYFLACEKLAREAKKRHCDAARFSPADIGKVLDAAGQLCAVMLFANLSGVALDPQPATPQFPALDDFTPPDRQAAAQALGSKLFRPAGEERVQPTHRSIAEYLAARRLASRIDREGLPVGRVLNLLQGSDGGVVAGLRGLFGWLAVHCHAARTRLIDADPLAVVLYGDVQGFTAQDKRRVLAGLRRVAEDYPGALWETRATHRLGTLATSELSDDFRAILQTGERDDASQAMIDWVLEILDNGAPIPDLAPLAFALIGDASLREGLRLTALQVWLKLADDPQGALALLDTLAGRNLPDPDDELLGRMLHYLYPRHLSPEKLLSHFHRPKNRYLIGYYQQFWNTRLLLIVPDEHLPALLDGLVNHPVFAGESFDWHWYCRMLDGLLERTLLSRGEPIAPRKLFEWLGIGGKSPRVRNERKGVEDWFASHSDAYKSVLSICLADAAEHTEPRRCFYKLANRLHGLPLPADLGLWYFNQVDKTSDDELARICLSWATSALVLNRCAAGLTLELLENWAIRNIKRGKWLEELLSCPLNGPESELAVDRIGEEQNRRARGADIRPYLASIRDGSASPELYHHLSGVWLDHFIDITGNTPSERFAAYCDFGDELLAAAEQGFRLCPLREDLPNVGEIIGLYVNQREHYVRSPCLIGMALLWRDGAENINALSDDTLRRMIAFRLTYAADETPEWFIHLVRQRSELVAEVFPDYALAALKSGKDFISDVYGLAFDPVFAKVAALAAPRLLEKFPAKIAVGQLVNLESLLKATLRHAPQFLADILDKKLSLKSMDIPQRVYWLGAAVLLNAEKYEAELWRYVGKSPVKTNHLADFLSGRTDADFQGFELSVKTLGKLIELIAPHAEVDRIPGAGRIEDAGRRGDQIRALINRLAASPLPEVGAELDRLLTQPGLHKLKYLPENARQQYRQRRREAEFRFPTPREAARVLAGGAPTSSADLAALALAHIEDIGIALRTENDDGFRAFWNIEDKKPVSLREENYCRDALLTRLRPIFQALGVDCQPEKDHANDKRVDINFSYRNEFELPIEIKRDDNPTLWDSLRTQLIGQYTIAPRAADHGIYLVLWFGDVEKVTGKKRKTPNLKDGKRKAVSPEELQARLEAQLDPDERRRVFVRVLDVSWPESATRR